MANFSEASFFYPLGEAVAIMVAPHVYADDEGKEHINARIEIESEGSGSVLRVSLPVASLKKLVVEAERFLQLPGLGEPQPNVFAASGSCMAGAAFLN